MDNSKQATLELGTKPVGKLLMQYALPAIAAMTAASLYNMTDSIFIGQGCGAVLAAEDIQQSAVHRPLQAWHLPPRVAHHQEHHSHRHLAVRHERLLVHRHHLHQQVATSQWARSALRTRLRSSS